MNGSRVLTHYTINCITKVEGVNAIHKTEIMYFLVKCSVLLAKRGKLVTKTFYEKTLEEKL